MKRRLVTLALMMAGVVSASAQSSTTVDWSNSASTLLRDSAGAALTQGSATVNSDGRLVELGYFTTATTADKFSGSWIPLTSAGSLPRTAIGDSFNLTGAGDGVIQFNTFFEVGRRPLKFMIRATLAITRLSHWQVSLRRPRQTTRSWPFAFTIRQMDQQVITTQSRPTPGDGRHRHRPERWWRLTWLTLPWPLRMQLTPLRHPSR